MHRRAGRTHGAAGAGRAQDDDAYEPWDARSAEALTCLYESEEGRLSRPPAGKRSQPEYRRPGFFSDADADEPGPVGRMWLEAHLSRLVERLHDTLARSSPERSLAALNGRLEEVEQRFAAALGRVAQRADVEGLRSIETHVLSLAERFEEARDRLDQIGAIDDQIRSLARKLDEAGEQRAGALEKLLRDSFAEWREGERRTAGALHNLEEAVSRLGDTVDAMEASRPAPDLTVPPLAEPAHAIDPSPFRAGFERTAAPHLYHAMLDAADYAPKPGSDGLRAFPPPLSAIPGERTAFAAGTVEWSAETDGGNPDREAGAKLTPGALRIMALRAKLRKSSAAGRKAARYYEPENAEAPSRVAFKRAGLSFLLMAGAAVLAGSTYFLFQAFVPLEPPASPAMIEPGAPPSDIKSDFADPSGRRINGEDAS